METIQNNIENITTLPDESTMDLFLDVGNALGFFETFNIKGINGDYTFYRGEYLLADLVAACLYLNLEGNENIKKQFLYNLKSENKQNMLKELGIYCLKYWEIMNPTSLFQKARVEKQMSSLKGKENFSFQDLPIISTKILPNRYHEAVEKKILIHEQFESELKKLKSIKECADQIQAESMSHSFVKGDNSNQINELTNKL